MALTTGILFGFVAMVGFALQDVVLKKCMASTSPYTIAFYRGIVISLLLVVYAGLMNSLVLPALDILALLFLIGVVGAVAYLSYLTGVWKGLVSIVNPISRASVILTIALSMIFFKESLTVLSSLGIALIVGGAMATSISWEGGKEKLKRHHLVRGAKYALLASVGWGVIFFLMKIPITVSGAVTAAVYFELLSFVFIALIVAPMGAVVKLDKGALKMIIVLGGLGAVATLSMTTALTSENVSIIIPIINSSTLLLVILSRVFLKEMLNRFQMLGVVAIAAGLLLIVG